MYDGTANKMNLREDQKDQSIYSYDGKMESEHNMLR